MGWGNTIEPNSGRSAASDNSALLLESPSFVFFLVSVFLLLPFSLGESHIPLGLCIT
jgi:hypothetical protein